MYESTFSALMGFMGRAENSISWGELYCELPKLTTAETFIIRRWINDIYNMPVCAFISAD